MSGNHQKLPLNIRKTKLIDQALEFWEHQKIQTSAQVKKCKESIQTLVFNWKLLSCICFGAAIFFLASSIFSSIILLPITSKQFFVILSLCSAGVFSYSYYLLNHDPSKGNVCGLLNFIALNFLLSAIGMVSDSPFLWTSIIGGIIGMIIRSGLTWGISLGLFGLWFCQPNLSETMQATNFSMSKPKHSALIFGIIAMIVSIAIKKITEHQSIFNTYRSVFRGSLVTSYIYLFGSLFLLSSIPQETALTMTEYAWAIALAGLSLTAIYCGVRNKLPITIRFGVVFFLLNILHQYVAFCEHLAIFDSYQPVLANLGLAAILWGISAMACYMACHHEEWENTEKNKKIKHTKSH